MGSKQCVDVTAAQHIAIAKFCLTMEYVDAAKYCSLAEAAAALLF